MTTAKKLHTLLSEALRCLDDGQIVAVRRKISYADVLVHEMTEEAVSHPARLTYSETCKAIGSARNPSRSSSPVEAQPAATGERYDGPTS